MTCRPVVEDFIFNEQGYSRLLEHNFNRKIDVSDSLVLERKKSTPQLGNEPGTSQLSFECLTKVAGNCMKWIGPV